MEKSRAIELLEHLAWDRDIERNPYGDALNMAIEALKAQLSQEGTTSDLISRQAALDAVSGCGICTRKLVDLPTIQPEPHEGHWILYDKRFPWRHIYKCSKCGNYLDFSGVNGGRGEVNFCPKCGAKMIISK